MNNYQPEEWKKSFDVADGDHVVTITKVENKVSKTGLNMHVVQYSVEGSNGEPFIDRICEGEYYNKNMTRFFDAFQIQRGNYNFASWINKKAYAHFEHKEEEFTDQAGNKKKVNKANLVYFHNNLPGNNNNGQFIPGQGWN